MQATLQMQAAAAAPAARRVQQTRALASPCVAPMQQRATGANAAKVGAITSQRNVAAHAKGAIKPMEATFTEFNLVDKTKKVREGRRLRVEAAAAAACKAPPRACGRLRQRTPPRSWQCAAVPLLAAPHRNPTLRLAPTGRKHICSHSNWPGAATVVAASAKSHRVAAACPPPASTCLLACSKPGTPWLPLPSSSSTTFRTSLLRRTCASACATLLRRLVQAGWGGTGQAAGCWKAFGRAARDGVCARAALAGQLALGA